MDSDDSLDESQGKISKDEIAEIKRASRLANARMNALHQNKGSRCNDAAHLRSEEQLKAQTNQQMQEINRNRNSTVQFEEAKRLRQALQDRDRELKECRYELKQLQNQHNTVQISEKSLESKLKAVTAEMKDSCHIAVKALDDKKIMVQSECDRLNRLVAGIERHTQHGHHAVASRTTISLLLKIKHGLDNLKRMVVDEMYHVPSNISNVHNSSTIDETGMNDVHKVKADALDGALLDMCKHLEEENMHLESSLAVAMAELEELKRESSVSKLIPHYRLAIVRARAHASALSEQLQREQQNNHILREQNERLLQEMSANVPVDVELKRSAILNFLNLKAANSNERNDAVFDNQVHPTSTMSTFLSDSCAANEQAKIVQQELAELDSEIDSLQMKLRDVATSRTASLVSNAIAGLDARKKM